MTLLELLFVICFTISVVAGFDTAKHAQAGLRAYVLGITVGLILGFGSVAAMWWTCFKLFNPRAEESTLFKVLFLTVALLWIVGTAGVSHLMVTWLLRLSSLA
jgi:hypothetical protein